MRRINLHTEGFHEAPDPVRRWAYAYACTRAEESNGHKPVEARLIYVKGETIAEPPHWELALAVGLRVDFRHRYPGGEYPLTRDVVTGVAR